MFDDEKIKFEETEEPAIVLVDVTTFDVVTDIRSKADQENRILGLEFITASSDNPAIFPNHDAITACKNLVSSSGIELQAMELSLDCVIRSMEFKYLYLKSLQYQEGVIQNQILLLKKELSEYEKYVNSHYDVEHHKTIDDSLLQLEID